MTEEVNFRDACLQIDALIEFTSKQYGLTTADAVMAICAWLANMAASQEKPDKALEDMIDSIKRYRDMIISEQDKMNLAGTH